MLTIAASRVAGFVTVIMTAKTDLTNLTVRQNSHVLSTYIYRTLSHFYPYDFAGFLSPFSTDFHKKITASTS